MLVVGLIRLLRLSRRVTAGISLPWSLPRLGAFLLAKPKFDFTAALLRAVGSAVSIGATVSIVHTPNKILWSTHV